jgi:hypothetical protein
MARRAAVVGGNGAAVARGNGAKRPVAGVGRHTAQAAVERGFNPDKVRKAVAERAAAEKKRHFKGVLCVAQDAEAEWVIQEPMNNVQAMLLIGYELAADGRAVFKDPEGNQIMLTNNVSNRPFRTAYAKRYMLDKLRRKWKLNGETIIIDENGHVQSGQHRLVGLIWAVMLWKKDPAKWAKYWSTPPVDECVIFHGISSDRDTVNTLDIGQKRTLSDVLFRDSRWPKDMPARKKQQLSNVLAGAARLVWLRAQGKKVSDAPHYPHSEALDFVEEHPGMAESVYHIWAAQGGEAADGQMITRYITMAYAAGLHYLMAGSATESEEYQTRGPEALNWALKDRADLFWSTFATAKDTGTDPIGVLKRLLRGTEASTSRGRDEIITMVIKAFNLWMDGKKKADADEIEPEMKEKDGKWRLAEDVRLGGMDVAEITAARERPEGEQPVDDRVGKKKGKKWAKGDTAWVYAQDGEHWFGKIVDVIKAEDGGTDLISLKGDDGKEYDESSDNLSVERPT